MMTAFGLKIPAQRAGLELMDMMAVYQEGAYERLCRYNFTLQEIVLCVCARTLDMYSKSLYFAE